MTDAPSGKRQGRATRVAMLVWNTLEHDARVRREAGTLSGSGYSVTVFALHAPGRTTRRVTLPTGVGVRRIGFLAGAALSRSGASRSVLGLLSIAMTQASMLLRIVAARPDVVHAHDVNMLPLGWLAAVLSRARLVYDAHEISTGREGYQHWRNVVAGLEKRFAGRADAVITTTDLRARYLARAYRIPRPLVLQNRPVIGRLAGRGRMRSALSLPKERMLVLYQGGLQSGRGLEKIVAAAAQVPDADFVMLGSGRMASRLEALAQRAGVMDRLHFVPARPLEELPDWTVDADIGLQVLENTCFNHFSADSNKLFEYIVAGVPVIASDLPEMRRIVREHDVGLLIKPGSLADLVAALRRLIDDSVLREAKRRNARQARSSLGWDGVEGGLLELYARISDR